MTYTELLARLASDPQKSDDWRRRLGEMSEKIARQARYLGRLIDDLLDVTRLESGKFTLDRETVDLREVVRQGVEQARTLDPSHHELDVALPEGDGLILAGDPRRLLQMVVNLVENALKYSPEGTQVDVALERQEGDDTSWANIRVADRGPGIPAAERDQIFTRFYQGGQTPRQARSGLGLGLYIAKGIVEQHGGQIGADSPDGGGTEITVRLPLGSPDQA
jgi:signal transduction histidine kinase